MPLNKGHAAGPAFSVEPDGPGESRGTCATPTGGSAEATVWPESQVGHQGVNSLLPLNRAPGPFRTLTPQVTGATHPLAMGRRVCSVPLTPSGDTESSAHTRGTPETGTGRPSSGPKSTPTCKPCPREPTPGLSLQRSMAGHAPTLPLHTDTHWTPPTPTSRVTV